MSRPGRATGWSTCAAATVLPGFHDAHNHMVGFGMSLAEVDLRSSAAGTLDELYAAVARRAQTTAPGDWVVGSGYDQNKIGAHPHRDALDQAAPGRRVWLGTPPGTCAWSTAWSWPTSASTRPPRICPAAGSPPTRTAVPPACSRNGPSFWWELVYPYPLAELTEAIGLAAAQYLKEGITSCTEAGIGGGWVAHSPAELAAYQGARDQAGSGSGSS